MILYLNHATTQQETGGLVSHLAECAACRKEMTENIKLHSKIKLAFNQMPEDIKKRAYDKIQFPKKEPTVTELIADDIIAAAHVPVLAIYATLARNLIRSPVNRIANYTLACINEMLPDKDPGENAN